MILNENESLNEVNDSLKLIQKTDGLTFGTDALLLASYINTANATGCELGGGTGIISMLLLSRGKISFSECVEVQEEFAELIKRNAELNGLGALNSVCADVREFKPDRTFDVVFTNPPYMKADSGRSNTAAKKNAARHEIFGDISDFCEAGKRLTRFGGSFYVVYRPDRLTDLICAMRSSLLEPKRMTFVHADVLSIPSMVLIEARRGGGVGAKITKPLIIYKDTRHLEYTDEMKHILECGSFPDDFFNKKRG